MNFTQQALSNTHPDISIRQIQPIDFESAFRCYHNSFPEGHNRYSFARIMRFQQQTCLAAELRKSKEIIGLILGFIDLDHGWMTALCVAPKHRRKGYATVLAIQLGITFLQLGLKKASFTTEKEQIITLAKKFHVTRHKWHANYFFDDAGRYVMVFDLVKIKRKLSYEKD